MTASFHYRGPGDLVRRLRQLRSPSERERTGMCYIEGARVVTQAIRAGVPITLGVLAPELLVRSGAWEAAAVLRASGAPLVELSAEAFGRIAFKEHVQGIGAVIPTRVEPIEVLGMPTQSWVALSGIGNPGNLGAIMRTCDAVGVAGLILLDETTDPFHPAAVRASMGALFAQRLVRATFAQFRTWAQQLPGSVVGTTPDAPASYRELRYPQPLILLLGSEREGLSEAQVAACDALVRIPMVGTSDSLNVAVAASVVLYEAFHQHQRGQSLSTVAPGSE
jgi:RNA methyltransferase, TrmH family